jgi:hypothetical protein
MDRALRVKAEKLARRFGTEEVTAAAFLQAMDQYGNRISDRLRKDKEEDQKEAENQKRQAYMQQMMMQQMMGGGGMPPGMAGMMEDE